MNDMVKQIEVYGGCLLWRRETKKVVISCEKPCGGAHIQRYRDDRMG